MSDDVKDPKRDPDKFTLRLPPHTKIQVARHAGELSLNQYIVGLIERELKLGTADHARSIDGNHLPYPKLEPEDGHSWSNQFWNQVGQPETEDGPRPPWWFGLMVAFHNSDHQRFLWLLKSMPDVASRTEAIRHFAVLYRQGCGMFGDARPQLRVYLEHLKTLEGIPDFGSLEDIFIWGNIERGIDE